MCSAISKTRSLKIRSPGKLAETFRKALQVANKILECKRELPSLLHGIEGGYLEPGASGAITRGKFEILPTGRNFFAIDPRTLPTKAAWQVGVATANKMLKLYLEKHGKYPETVGEVLWSIDAYKADGEQLAQILYLLGVEPVWEADGSIKGLRVIPLDELKRPRIDCLVRLSGIARDTLPNYAYLIDEAVEKVVVRDEPEEMNFVRKHYLEYVSKLISLGFSAEKAGLYARFRVFCAPPGAYGAGVNYAVETSAWRSDEELAKTWVQWSGYAYGKAGYGVEAHEVLMLALHDVDVVNRNHISDEHDIFGCCCYFAYHGGFYNAAKEASGREVEIVTVNTRDLANLDVRDMKLEIERVARAKLLNPLWIGEMKKHGYRGASEFSKKILHLYGWSATTKLVDKWVFDQIAKTYVLDEEMRKWFEQVNPWALEEIARRLVEAAERELWKPDDEFLQRLREAYAEVEGILEERIVSSSERQGGAITIFTMGEVQGWQEKASKVVKLWKKLKA